MDQLLEPRERSTHNNWFSQNIADLIRNYKSQMMALAGAVIGSLPGFIIIAIIFSVLIYTVGVAENSWQFVLIPYVTVVMLLTISSAAILKNYSLSWDMLDDAATGNLRSSPSKRPKYRMGILCVSGLSFLTSVALVISLGMWMIVGLIFPSLGPFVAVAFSAIVLLFERWLVRRREKSIAVVGIKIGKVLIRSLSSLPARDYVTLNNEAKIATNLVTIAVNGRVTS